jgi:hypothetical protein
VVLIVLSKKVEPKLFGVLHKRKFTGRCSTVELESDDDMPGASDTIAYALIMKIERYQKEC